MYFGSVRFFKNLILLAVVVLIAVPTLIAVHSGSLLRARAEEASAREAELSSLRAELDEARRALQAKEEVPEDVPPAAAGDVNAADAKTGDADAFSSEPIYYQDLYPDFYAPEPYHATQRQTGTIYLTFDGGPSDNTAQILDALAAQGVKATFFVSGQTYDGCYQRMRDIVNQGHTLGMRSYSQDYAKVYSSVESFLDDMYQIFVEIREATGVTPSVFRFPGGSINAYNAGIYQELLAEMLRRGFVPCDWNLSGEDALSDARSADQIVENVLAHIDHVERGFVLLHDSGGKTTTAEALEPLIEALRERGFQFERLTAETKPVLFVYQE